MWGPIIDHGPVNQAVQVLTQMHTVGRITLKRASPLLGGLLVLNPGRLPELDLSQNLRRSRLTGTDAISIFLTDG